MTYEEAKKNILGWLCWHGNNDSGCYFYGNSNENLCNICEIHFAIEAIEKQIPKRIVDGNFCPHCNIGFGIHYPEWCGNCGQRIDYNLETKK